MHNNCENKMTRLCRVCIIGEYIIPMFIAGGTAYCRWRMNWYRGSGWMRPSQTAPFTSAVPSSGSRMYLTTMTPAITDGGTLAPPCTPGKSFMHHPSCLCSSDSIYVFLSIIFMCMIVLFVIKAKGYRSEGLLPLSMWRMELRLHYTRHNPWKWLDMQAN